MEDKRVVLVTGATGFLASQLIKKLLEDGYPVRGTVQSLKDETAIGNLYNLCPDAASKLEIIEADLLDSGAWYRAVKDCRYVLLVASAIPESYHEGKDAHKPHKDGEKRERVKEEDLIQASVEGTLNVLRAIVTSDVYDVYRVVLTSSLSAIAAHGGNSIPYTEMDWPRQDDPAVLTQSKAMVAAERAAWDFVKQLPHGKKFDLSVVNPAGLLGPALEGKPGPTSDLLCQLLERKISSVPAFILPFVDVRDVVKAHIECMHNTDAIGQRHILYSESMWIKYMAELLDVEFGLQGYHVPTSQELGIMTTVSSWFDHHVKENKMVASQPMVIDNTRMKAVLGISPIDLKMTIIDMAYSLIENGFVKKTDKYRGPANPKTTV